MPAAVLPDMNYLALEAACSDEDSASAEEVMPTAEDEMFIDDGSTMSDSAGPMDNPVLLPPRSTPRKRKVYAKHRGNPSQYWVIVENSSPEVFRAALLAEGLPPGVR